MTHPPLRLGTLGAARITPMALVRPARSVPEVEVVAVAARDRRRAEKFATKHGIGRVHDSYEDLLADDEIDAIYNPLPNAWHAPWSLKALEAGKHVLCEKPFTSNAAEAREVADAGQRKGLVVMEAFHWRYHPLAERLVEISRSGELGELRHVEAVFCIPLPMRGDIRWQLDLAGGSTMDVGAYTASIVRHVSGEEPEVVSAHAKLRSDGIDRWLTAELKLPSGATARVTNSMWSGRVLACGAKVIGSRGRIKVLNPVGPHVLHRFSVTVDGSTRKERFPRTPTYTYQLQAFCRAVREGADVPTDAEDAVKNMELLDAIYDVSGLGSRPSIAACP
jgi:predicted dehydrogenase